MKLSKEQVQAATAPEAPSWSKTYPEAVTIKSVRHVATEAGGYALLTAGLTEGAQVLRTDADGTVTWKKTYADRGEPTALAVLESDGKATGFAFTKHGGNEGTIDGQLTKLSLTGEVVWAKSFGDPAGGVGKYAGLSAGNPKLIYDECWSIQGTSDGGMITGCGTGIEGCDAWPKDSAIQKECLADPRNDWRGMVTRFDGDGKLVWQRLDNFTIQGEETTTSACEYVTLTKDGGVLSVVDEGFGIGALVLGPDGSGSGSASASSATSGAGGASALRRQAVRSAQQVAPTPTGGTTETSSGCSLSLPSSTGHRGVVMGLMLAAALAAGRRRNRR